MTPQRLATVLLATLAATIVLVSGQRGAERADAGAPQAPQTTQLLATELSADGLAAEACHTSFRPGQPGVATKTLDVAGPGQVDARLNASGGDWDLALFDAAGRTIAGGATTTSHEVADGWVLEGDVVRVQACRRAGDAATADLDVDFTALDTSRKPERVQAVSVDTPTRADKARLTALGLDMTEHGGNRSLGVILHGADDAAKLRAAGFTYDVKTPDLVAQGIADREADARYAARTRRSNLPSGRDTYRTLAEYEEELKALAQANPGLVRVVELPHKTWLGRTVMGVEITQNVNANDGKPAFFNMGVHHAREWPSGEHAMEWAYELVNSYKAGNARTKRIVENSRNIIVPIVNPDGFNASRSAVGAPDEGRDETAPDTAYLALGIATLGEYRRKNCRLPDDSEAGNCLTSGGVGNGVDPNRNYGGLWGGPGATSDQTSDIYFGPAPFSEPETRNVQWVNQRHPVTTLITNHTTAGLVLRAPGLAALGDPVDENRGYKALGDDMAKHNGYFSQKSFELYDTTGTTEDWTYNTAGGYGFTFEIYCGAPNYETGDCDDPAFHPTYSTMVKEWDGTNPQADHATDPGPHKGFDGQGNREAYYIAAESTLDAARHSVLEGDAPAGATLRLKKQFKTETFPQAQEEGEDKPIEFDDGLEFDMVVPDGGKVDWHVNPSTRPIVEKKRGRSAKGPPSKDLEFDGAASATDPQQCPTYYDPTGEGLPENKDPSCYAEHAFEIPAGANVDNYLTTIRVEFEQEDDFDLEIYKDTDGDGTSEDEGNAPLFKSGNGATNGELGFEEVTLPQDTSGKFVVRVVNFAARTGNAYKGKIAFQGPPPPRPELREAYTLTCEKDGRVYQTSEVFIERGERKTLDLAECRRALSPPATPTTGPGCVVADGFRSAKAVGRGRKVRFSFARRVTRPVTVDVFQQSVGRRVIGERLVARYRNRARSFTWNGKANRRGRRVTNGYYFVRYRMNVDGRLTDVRRVTLRRQGGRFAVRKAFYRRASCGVLRSYKLTRPVFGGRRNRAVSASFRLSQASTVSLQVLRGKKVVRRYRATQRRANVTYRARLRPEGLPRGDYRFRITVRSGGRTVRSTLTTRRL